MADSGSGSINVPKIDNWPGAFDSFKLVKPRIVPQVWNVIAAAALGILSAVILQLILGVIFKHGTVGVLLSYVVSIAAGAFLQATIITILFAALKGDELSFNGAINYGVNRILPMAGLLIVMDVLLIVSFILLIIPFLIILPRVYLAPYFFIYNDCTVSEALAASWHLSKGHSTKVYEIILINLGLAILFITVIGIPFAIYWGIINSGSFALLVMSLSETKHAHTKKTAKLKTG